MKLEKKLDFTIYLVLQEENIVQIEKLKYDEYTALMKEMIVFLKNSGYKIDEIVDEFKILIPEDKTIDER